MLSFTMQLPLNSTASQAMIQPCGGITITSPGTRILAEMFSQPETYNIVIKRGSENPLPPKKRPLGTVRY
jgi:hypothetical protein